MDKIKNFTESIAWQKAHKFVLLIYELTSTFPKSEVYGLSSQMRRAAVSIPANIAEGFKKRSNKDKIKFLNIAQGSLEESRYYLILSRDLNYCVVNDLSDLLVEIGKLLTVYIKKLDVV
ncbi:MAG: four helix bundle protein [Bacteroidetes bacterium]|nr:four helix bundle protein [Bacteroidota bacterium]